MQPEAPWRHLLNFRTKKYVVNMLILLYLGVSRVITAESGYSQAEASLLHGNILSPEGDSDE